MNDRVSTATTAAAEAARIAADTAVGKAATGFTLTGSAAVVYGGYTLQEWAMLLGAITALGGLAIQVLTALDARRARQRKTKRDEEWHQARMDAWRNDSIGPNIEQAVQWEAEQRKKFEDSLA